MTMRFDVSGLYVDSKEIAPGICSRVPVVNEPPKRLVTSVVCTVCGGNPASLRDQLLKALEAYAAAYQAYLERNAR